MQDLGNIRLLCMMEVFTVSETP